MFRSTWLNKFLAVKSRDDRRRQSAQSRRRASSHRLQRLQLEHLEDRCVPSTLTVTSNADDGKGESCVR